MKIRRYYPRGFRGKTYSDAYIEELVARGVDPTFIDTARVELLLSREEQEVFYKRCVSQILYNTRWVLDNLERLVEFKVNWENYKRKTPQKNTQKTTKKPKTL